MSRFWLPASPYHRRPCQGYARLIRYADAYIACFQYSQEAKLFREAMETRLNRFLLEVTPEKTRYLEFGKYVHANVKGRGERLATFDFLGLTHYFSRSRDGTRFRMKRKTITQRFTVRLLGYKEWLMKSRTLPASEILNTTTAKLHGHFAYYGVTDKSCNIANFAYEVTRLLFKWLSRRGVVCGNSARTVQ